MSTALVTTLRESVGYLCDGGFEQTAQVMALAADEIERLNRRIQELELREAADPRRADNHLRMIVPENATLAR